MKKNLISLYDSATPDELNVGLNWYPVAHEQIRVWAKQYNRTVDNVACIMAACSPQQSWERNISLTERALEGLPLPEMTNAFKAKVKKIVQDRIRDTTLVFKNAPKVESFSYNLMGEYWPVTIDTHMIQAIHNNPLMSGKIKPIQYDKYVNIVREAAWKVGVKQPAIFQAVCWVVWRGRYSPEEKRAMQRRKNG